MKISKNIIAIATSVEFQQFCGTKLTERTTGPHCVMPRKQQAGFVKANSMSTSIHNHAG